MLSSSNHNTQLWTKVIEIMVYNTDYRCPMKTFFIESQKLLCLGRQIGPINISAFGVLLAKLSATISNYQQPFWYNESLVHVFHYSTMGTLKSVCLSWFALMSRDKYEHTHLRVPFISTKI